MSTQLDEFCALFPSEKRLQEVLVDLLSKLDAVTGVRCLQGATELGKDIVFYRPDAFGKKRLNACVVKNTSITGSVASPSGARTVLFQAQQAFDTPYVNASGQNESVEHVYVITPHVAKPDAMESIKGGLLHRSGQVTFLCGNDLMDIFKERWPSFLVFHGDFLGRYLNDLRLNVDSDPNLSALILRHSIIATANRLLSSVYVQQALSARLAGFRARALSWYPSLLTGHVTRAELEDGRFNLSILAGILVQAPVWGRSADQKKLRGWVNAALKLQRIIQDLPTLWNDAYRQYLRTCPPGEAVSQSHAAVMLSTASELAAEYTSALGEAKNCWNAYLAALSQNDKSVQVFPSDAIAVLLDPHYPEYCALAESAARSPLALEKTIGIREPSISNEEFTQIQASLLIMAPAGFGKTSFCKHNALRDAEQLLDGVGDILPIYVPLHQIAAIDSTDFAELFLRAEHLREVVLSGDREHVPFRRIRMYLDGLDEVPNAMRRSQIIRAATTAALAWPIQAVITGREHVYDHYLTPFPRVALNGLTDAGVRQLIRKWLDTDSEGIAEMEADLSRHAALRDLMKVPLLGTLMIGVYRKVRRLPETRIALYDMFVDLLCGGWDLVRNIQRESRFSATAKITVLKKLAGQMHARGLRYASPEDMRIALGFSLSKLEVDCDSFIEELLRDGLITRSGVVLLFSHLSFQEFLAAKDLADPTGRAQAAALRRFFLGDDWWKEVLEFYLGLLNDPHSGHEWLSTMAHGMVRSSRKAVEAEVLRRARGLDSALRKMYPDFEAASL